MKRGILATLVVAVGLGVLVFTLGTKTSAEPGRGGQTGLQRAYAQLPLAFEANRGQAQRGVGFLARGAGYALMLRSARAVLTLGDGSRLHLRLAGGSAQAQLRPEERLRGRVNYLIGNDRSRWLRGIETYARITAAGVYPGIDVAYHGKRGRLEYDFLVHPGANPGQISLAFEGAERIRLDRLGRLLLDLPGGTLRQLPPRIYQQVEGRRRQVAGGFVLNGDRVGFALGAYDRSRVLVIDPVLVYSTYLGADGVDSGTSIAVDSATGSAYVAGYTPPGEGPAPDSLDSPSIGGGDVFVMKLSASGNTLIYSTLVGGNSVDRGLAIGLDNSGSAFVTGSTNSIDFPTTAGAFDTSDNAGTDAFVTKLNSAGSALAYSTYLGGNSSDSGSGIHVDDAAGSATVSGSTSSSDFPITSGAYDTLPNGGSDAFVTRINSAGSAPLVFSTYLGGGGNDSAHGVDVDDQGSAYVTGRTESADFPTNVAWDTSLDGSMDAFAAKVGSTGATLPYATYLGGDGIDEGFGVAVDPVAKTAYVVGQTASGLPTPFPTTPGAYDTSLGGVTDAFATKFTSAGNGLAYSSYLGGGSDDRGSAIAIDNDGRAYVTGATFSTNFPTTNPFQGASGGFSDAFVSSFDPAGSALNYSTYLGGGSDDFGYGIAVDRTDAAYVTGVTYSSNFPTLNPVQPTRTGVADAFATKLAMPATAAVLRSLTVRLAGARVVLRWQTGSELGLLGFNVLGDRRGLRVRLNRTMIPAAGGTGGHEYLFRAPRRITRYWLQDVKTDGSRVWHGPVSVS